ncbi:MAG: hypothetical protein ACP5QP_07225 [Brevinematia bacterium]
MKRLIFIFVVLFSLGSVAFPVSFGAFGGISEGLSFSPTFVVPFDPMSVDLDLVGAYGFNQNFDLQFSLSRVLFEFSPFNAIWNGLWVMPRFDFGGFSILPYNILALHIGFGGGFTVGLQYHTELSIVDSIFSIEFNGIFNIIPNPTLDGIVAPVFYLEKILNVPIALYLESDFSVIPDLGSDIILGIYWGIAKNLGINLGYNFNSSLVGWISFSF